MRVDRIEVIGSIDDSVDIYDDNFDVIVDLEDGLTYVVVVGTPKNLLTLMANEKSDFLSPGDPFIIIRAITQEIIEKTIKAYAAGDAYWLKFYSASLDTKTLDVLKNRSIARDKLLDDLLKKGESPDIENYSLIDFDMDNL